MSDVFGTTISLRPDRNAVNIDAEPDVRDFLFSAVFRKVAKLLTCMADNQITLRDELVDIVPESECFDVQLASSGGRWGSSPAILHYELVEMGVFEGSKYRSFWLEDANEIFEKGGPNGHERCPHFGAKLLQTCCQSFTRCVVL